MLQLADRVGVSLRELLPDAEFFGAPDIRITSCCADSRQCQENDLFIALIGGQMDGHQHADEAVRRGAAAVLTERLLPTSAAQCIVPDSREAYGQLCQALAGYPSQKMTTYGVTGSVGKTTSCMLLASVLEAGGMASGVTSTVAYSDSVKVSPASRTTPSQAELAEWMARMTANGCDAAVLEMSSQGLAERRCAGVELDAAILTNIRRDHLDRHGSLLNYRKAKSRILELLKPNGFAVINVDDASSASLLNGIEAPVFTIGINSSAELMATPVERHAGEQTFLLTAGQETAAVSTRMIGDVHIYNCLAAAAVGLVAGLDLTTVIRGLEAVESVPGRMEYIDCGQPFGVYVDYAKTPDTLGLCLSSVRKVTRGRLICVFGAEGERSQDSRCQLGRAAERYADVSVITNNNPRYEEPLQIAHDILDGWDRPGDARVLPDRQHAMHWALSEARPGDAVVIAGKGHEDYQVVGGKTSHLDDRDIARQWLYEVGAKVDYPNPDILPFRRSA